MKAIIIFYRGNDVPQSVVESLANMLTLSGVEPVHCSTKDDETVSNAVMQSSLTESLNKGKLALRLLAEEAVVPSDQEAIDNAAVYITEKILNHFTTQTMITVAIVNCISSGDQEMRTAVEILATKKGVIKEPKLTKPILNVIKSIYVGMKEIS